MKINPNGAWVTKNPDRHMVSSELCDEVISLMKEKHLEDAVDLGCGNAFYVSKIIESGFKCDGFDGNPLTEDITDGLAKVLDLSQYIHIGKYDMVLSLEVGEHIPSQFEDIFLDNLAKTAKKYIVLSWAVEGQRGTGHVNCRNNDWVINQMKLRGFKLTNDFNKIREAVLERKFRYFKNTILTFKREEI